MLKHSKYKQQIRTS